MSYTFEQLGTEFLFTEGPLWHPTGKFLLFSDIPGDHMRRWSPARGLETFRKPSRKANGNTYDRQGRLLTCEHASSQVTRTETDGRMVSLVGPDPASPELLVDDFDRPNGLCLSLDEARLFVNDTTRQQIRVFEVAPNGTLRNGRLWAETKGDKPGGPDGMKIDSAGNVYCTGPGGIHVFTPDGALREVIEVPEYTANFAWGDDDYRSLFITASTSLYRIRVTTPGLPVL